MAKPSNDLVNGIEILSPLCTAFGFKNKWDYIHSLIHFNLLTVTVPLSTLSVFVEQYFGLKVLTVFSFVLLLTLELVSGLWASKIRKGKLAIASDPLKRFGFKLVAWLIMIFILNSFKLQWENENAIIFHLFDWLYSLIIIYISFEYFISVLENIAVISGKSDMLLIKSLRKKLHTFLDLEEEQTKNETDE